MNGIGVVVGGLGLIALAGLAAVAASKSSAATSSAASSSSSGTSTTAPNSTTTPQTPSTPPGGYDQTSWARALLTAGGWPVTSQNVANVVAWENAEGGHWHNSALYNPLNTTQPEPGSTTFESSGIGAAAIRIYSSWDSGLTATVATLNNGDYGGILSALESSAPLQSFAQAVYSSPWGTRSGIA